MDKIKLATAGCAVVDLYCFTYLRQHGWGFKIDEWIKKGFENKKNILKKIKLCCWKI